MAGFYDIRARFETDGVFWDPNDPTRTFAAHLSSAGPIDLTISPEVSAAPERFFSEVASDTPVPKCLLGLTTSLGPCTLIGLHELPPARYMHGATAQVVLSRRYRADACIVGRHLESDSDSLVHSTWFTYSGIVEWFRASAEIAMTEEAISISFPRKPMAVVDFCLPNIRSRINIVIAQNVRWTLQGRRVTARTQPRVTIEPVEPRSLRWFIDLAWRLENFFSVCLGTVVRLRAVSFQTPGDEDGWFIANRRRRRIEKSDLQAWIQCDSSHLASAIATWLAVPEVFRPLENLVYGAIHGGSLVAETEFLSLAQAIESFHRLTEPTAARLSFHDRVRALLSRIKHSTAHDLLGDITVFEETLRQTRNHFTHPGIKKEARVLTEASELFLFNQRLHALLRLLMLVYLGFAEENVRGPVQYQSQRWMIL